MTRRCVVAGCSSTSADDVSLHLFPKDPKTRKMWTKKIRDNRVNWTGPSEHSYVCSKHFTDEMFRYHPKLMASWGKRIRNDLVLGATPTIFPKPSTPNPSRGQGSAVSASTPSSAAATPTDSTARHASSRYKRQLIRQILNASTVKCRPHEVPTVTCHSQTESSVMPIEQEIINAPSEVPAEPCHPIEPEVHTHNKSTQTVLPDKKDARIQTQSGHWQKTKGNQTSMHLVTASTQWENHDDDSEEDEDEESNSDQEVDYDEDEDWEPYTDSVCSEDFEMKMEKGPVHAEHKFIVFESQIEELFQFCSECRAESEIKKTLIGTCLNIKQKCTSCGWQRVWSSQPLLGDTPAGNVLLSGAILFAGATATKVLRVFQHMKVATISLRTFLEHQRQYLQPVIEHVWARHQSSTVEELSANGDPLNIGGDGRADTPGFSAKYGAYTIMDLDSNKVVHTELVQSNEVGSSTGMEKEGFIRCMMFLYAVGLAIGTLVTDRHSAIRKWVGENMTIDHRFDIWHIAKNVSKKIKAAAKIKDCEQLRDWKQSIVNHLYWIAASTQNGDKDIMTAKWESILNHVMNIHTGHSTLFPSCLHPAITERTEKDWIKPSTKASNKLETIITNRSIVQGISNLSANYQTSTLEAFHSLLNHFMPKMIGFSFKGMLSRLHLAALHYNENSNRKQMVTKTGSSVFTVVYPKFKQGNHTVQKRMTSATFCYVDELMSILTALVDRRMELCAMMGQDGDVPPPLCSEYQRPDKKKAVESKFSRFAGK